MARPLRIEFEGATYLVTSKSNSGFKVFCSLEDPKDWIEILGTVCNRYEWKVYAYCLLPEGYQLVVETIKPTISIGMRQLNGVYTQNFNTRYHRRGSIFRGRFKSVLIQREKYLHSAVGYVLSSPVRYGFVKLPRQYKWSSLKLADGKVKKNWFAHEWFEAEMSAYLDNFTPGVFPWEYDLMKKVRNQIYLGDDDFVREMKNRLSKKCVGRDRLDDKKRYDSIRSEFEEALRISGDRDKAITVVFLSGKYTMKEIAKSLSLHFSTVSRVVKRYENLIQI